MTNPLLEELVFKLRDPKTSNVAFRECLEDIGYHLGLQIAQDLDTKLRCVTTLLDARARHRVCYEDIVLVPILRAGIAIYPGLQKAFPESETGFIGAMRDEETLKPTINYVALPDVKGKVVIISDPMIATGGSIVDSAKIIEERSPKKIIVAGAIASIQGIKKISEYDNSIRVYTAAVDPLLNKKGYIVPGLGNAGDRCFGPKVDKP